MNSLITRNIMLGLLFFCLGQAHGENWISVAKTQSGDIEHLIDIDSIKQEGNYFSAWAREKLIKPIDRGLFKSAGYERLTQSAIDCNHGGIAILRIVVLGKQGDTLDDFTTKTADIKFAEVVPGSVGHNLIGTVCKGQADEMAKVSKIVDDFAKDPAHPYFDELADEIAVQIKAGKELQEAYDTAVWANPVTRQKELARIQLEKDSKTQNEFKGGFGTAWLSDSGYLVTAYHVIDGASQLSILLPDNSVLRAQVVASDMANDLAILSAPLPASVSRGIALAKAPTPLGATVFTIGFPHPEMLGLKPKFTSGQVSSSAGLADDPRILQISTPVQSGNSGGPLVNKNGEAVGVISSKLNAAFVFEKTGDHTQNINYAVKVRYLQGLLADVPKRSSVLQKIRPGTVESMVSQINNAVFLLVAE